MEILNYWIVDAVIGGLCVMVAGCRLPVAG
jgi:hypothetical protein